MPEAKRKTGDPGVVMKGNKQNGMDSQEDPGKVTTAARKGPQRRETRS